MSLVRHSPRTPVVKLGDGVKLAPDRDALFRELQRGRIEAPRVVHQLRWNVVELAKPKRRRKPRKKKPAAGWWFR